MSTGNLLLHTPSRAWRALTAIVTEIGGAVMFFGEIIRISVHHPPDPRDVLGQIWSVSVQSLSTTMAGGFFVGALMSVQFSAQLKQFSALSVLGGLSTSGTIRELGPLLIAFMLSGKVGAFTSAELGTMKVTEQIDAMRCLGTNPMQYLIVPRFFAIVVSSFFLVLAGLLTSIGGGAVLGILVGHMNAPEYLSAIPLYVTWTSVGSGLFKCFMFSALLGTICTYKGYTTTGGAKGVGRTVIMTSLSTMVGIVLMDWLTSYIARAVAQVLGLPFG